MVWSKEAPRKTYKYIIIKPSMLKAPYQKKAPISPNALTKDGHVIARKKLKNQSTAVAQPIPIFRTYFSFLYFITGIQSAGEQRKRIKHDLPKSRMYRGMLSEA